MIETELRFVKYQVRLPAAAVEFQMPEDWEVTDDPGYGLFLRRPQPCSKPGPGAGISIHDWTATGARFGGPSDYASWRADWVNYPGIKESVIEERSIQVDGSAAVMVATKRQFASDATYTPPASTTYFATLVMINGRFYELGMSTPDQIIENSRTIYERFLDSIEFAE